MDASFDFITARFLLQHLPDPAAVLREAYRLLAPGGAVAILDADDMISGFTDPMMPALRPLQLAMAQRHADNGGSRFVGRHLVKMLRREGFARSSLHAAVTSSDEFERGAAVFETQLDVSRFDVLRRERARNGMPYASEERFLQAAESIKAFRADPEAQVVFVTLIGVGFKSAEPLASEGCGAEARSASGVSGVGRRLLRALALADGTLTPTDRWLLSWQRRLECWYLALPVSTRARLGDCVHAFALHLGSRLDAAWRAALAMRGRPAPEAAPVGNAAAGGDCAWIGEEGSIAEGGVQLPSFPEFPARHDFSVPPLPRLLPSSLQLQSAAEAWQQSAPQREQLGRGAHNWAHVGAGASVGVVAGSLLLLLSIGHSRRRRGHRGGFSNRA